MNKKRLRTSTKNRPYCSYCAHFLNKSTELCDPCFNKHYKPRFEYMVDMLNDWYRYCHTDTNTGIFTDVTYDYGVNEEEEHDD